MRKISTKICTDAIGLRDVASVGGGRTWHRKSQFFSVCFLSGSGLLRQADDNQQDQIPSSGDCWVHCPDPKAAEQLGSAQ